MTDNTNDNFDAMPSITPEREDIADHNGRVSIDRHKKDGAMNATYKAQQISGDMRTLIAMALLAFTLLLVIGGLVYLRHQLQKTEQSLLAATTRVEQLEARLVSTDTTMTKSEVLLGAKLKSMDVQIDNNKSEIRRLAGVSDKNTRAIQVQSADLQQQKPILQSVVEQAKQTEDQVAIDGALLKNVDNTVKEAVQRMEIAQENINDLSSDIKSVKDKQLATDTNLGKRVAAVEDNAKSTDVFRRNTLDELRKLKEELLKQTTGAGTKPTP